ncbi:hypothetical protein EJ07DRAFT_155540 [Lizonia empirigonia]|nr:hypothetical protein EJ07DRAFT_155540 [Lizonia empirigonia]
MAPKLNKGSNPLGPRASSDVQQISQATPGCVKAVCYLQSRDPAKRAAATYHLAANWTPESMYAMNLRKNLRVSQDKVEELEHKVNALEKDIKYSEKTFEDWEATSKSWDDQLEEEHTKTLKAQKDAAVCKTKLDAALAQITSLEKIVKNLTKDKEILQAAVRMHWE